MYYAIRDDNALKATTFIIQIKTFINFKSLIDNALKRKIEHSTNVNRILNVDAMQTNSITNYLIKKSRSNKSITLSLVLTSTLIENSINEINVS